MLKRGGKRPGAGRPPRTGVWGEPTKPMRCPEGLASAFALFRTLYASTKDVLTAARLLVAQLENNEKKNG